MMPLRHDDKVARLQGAMNPARKFIFHALLTSDGYGVQWFSGGAKFGLKNSAHALLTSDGIRVQCFVQGERDTTQTQTGSVSMYTGNLIEAATRRRASTAEFQAALDVVHPDFRYCDFDKGETHMLVTVYNLKTGLELGHGRVQGHYGSYYVPA